MSGDTALVGKDRQIPTELQVLGCTVEQMDGLLNTLGGKLMPVLREQPPNPPADPACAADVVIVASQIRALRFRLEALNEVISSFIDRVEV